MIKKYKIRDFALAMATAKPRHILIEGRDIWVFTGADIPPPIIMDPPLIDERVVIDALMSAGKTKAEARVMIEASRAKIFGRG